MKLTNHIYCLLTICLWSTIELAGKLIGEGINPFAITAWRFLIGGLVLIPFALRQYKRGSINITFSSILQLGGLGILNVVCSMLLLQLAIYYGKASLAALIISMNPLFVSLFASFLIKEKLPFIHVISLVIGLIGLSLIIFHEQDMSSNLYRNLPLSILFAVLAAMGFGVYTVLTKRSVATYGNLVTNAAAFIIGGLALTLINLIIGKSMLFQPIPRNIAILAYLGIGVTGIAYLLYFEGMKVLGAARASIYFFLKPVLAVLLAYLFLHEVLSMWQIVGMILVSLALCRNLLRR
ncbi:MAG TPA: EamA family transporter [Candidatus Cloacimonadota bacterium]|nr:EamA family transporter [Candidatus Cloacimonadota bacterium]